MIAQTFSPAIFVRDPLPALTASSLYVELLLCSITVLKNFSFFLLARREKEMATDLLVSSHKCFRNILQ